ncbi:MAG: DNA polymerase III subunit alpha [Lentisphaeria bacterium]|nr:DNA polymerase III subunit alpha [Lentisphaeria bacterium]
MPPPFVHLHVHTDFSLLDGTAKCADIAKAAKEFGMPAVACTDHGNMCAAMEFTKAMQAEGIKPILGCEFYVAPTSRLKQDNSEQHYSGFHLVCLAETYQGYVNLCHLNEEAWLRGFYYKPRVDKEILKQYAGGIIALSACLGGEIAAKFKINADAAAEKALNDYLDIFGPDHFFLELQNHGLPEDQIVNEKLVALARRRNVPLVATNDSHYLKKEHAEAHDLFLCIGTQTNILDENRFRFPGGPEYYFKSPDEMARLFPEQPDALANTVAIAERCNVHLPTVGEDKANHYPEYPLPADFKGSREEYLRDICAKGMQERYDFNPNAPELDEDQTAKVQRMDYELGVIRQTGFTSYFLVVWDFLDYARRNGIPLGPGRGSGAGSLVAYLTHITDIDPLRYNLLFERFLNPDRVSPPDFDIDLCERRRVKVIEYVRQRYGAPNVVQIGTFGTLKAKAVIKDVARALGRTFEEGNRLSKLIPADPKMTLTKALEENAELKDLLAREAWVQDIWRFATVLEGLNRNMSIHAAGVIIGDMPVANVCPIAKGASDEPITQFPAGPCEELGLLKMDFLGLRNLTIIQDALDLIRKNRGLDMASSAIPEGDQAAYDLLNKGNTIGVFQLESGGMQDLCRRFGVSRLEDIIALIALYRPGPMNFLDEFINRKMGRIQVTYDVPEMEPILRETYGIMLYQEQVMQVVQAVGGFSLGQADIMRRAMGKKKPAEMAKMLADFQEGCRKRGLEDTTIQAIWDKILLFAGYGFNKSHSAAYGMLSYRTAYLKANFPAEFMAAVLTSELGNAEKMTFFLRECRAMNITILPPDVNVCDATFSVDGANIRFGLAAIKGIGTAAVAGIIKARDEGGPFRDLLDFCERVDGNSKRLMENLIKAGAMDCFDARRSQLLAICEDALNRAQEALQDRKSGQGSLFDLLQPEDKKQTELTLPDIPEWPLRELLAFEKELLGFYVTGHPIEEYLDLVNTYQSDDIADLPGLTSGTMVRVGAYINGVDPKITKKDGKAWAILNLEGRDGTIECLVFPKEYDNIRSQDPAALADNRVVFVEGELNQRDQDEAMRLQARAILSPDQATETLTREVHIRLYEEEVTGAALTAIHHACREHPGPVPLSLGLVTADGDLVFSRSENMGIAYSLEFRRKIAPYCRPDAIIIKGDHTRPKPTPRRGGWRRGGADD